MKKTLLAAIIAVLFFAQLQAQVVTKGLKAYHSFNGNTKDASGNSNDATNQGAFLTTNKDGDSNQAYGFKTANANYMDLAEAYDYQYRTITLMFYVESMNTTTRGYIYCSDNPNMQYGNVDISVLKVGSTPKVWFLVSDGYPGVNGSTISESISLKTWYTATIINDGDSATFYLNCKKIGRVKNNKLTSKAGNNNAILGAARQASNQFFDGKIDEVRVYDRALSLGELDSLCLYYNNKKPASTYSTSGRVFLGNSKTPADYGSVYLIKYNPADSTLAAVDTTSFVPKDSGEYVFKNVAAGKYLIKAFLSTTSGYHDYFLPTYHDSSLQWSGAKDVVVSTSNTAGVVIHLVQGSNGTGSGFIGGKVTQGANKKAGDPLDNIEIVLLDANKKPLRYATTDSNGYFNFDKLPYGSYSVFAEVVGVTPAFGYYTLNSEYKTIDDIGIKINKKSTSTYTLIGEQNDVSSSLNIYPNPTLGLVVISGFETNHTAHLKVMGMDGRILINQRDFKDNGVDLSSLPKGIYVVEVIQGNKIQRSKLMLQ
ncbi:MAG: T9SS type A sorting domain-containing protein [Bacteroidetes bacterium]|nr:T9SS type A sorting domain-containing protein [Bacteroidota bacterium]